MKKRILDFLIIFLFIIIGSIAYVSYKYTSELEYQIHRKDSLLKDNKFRDSIYSAKTKSYSDTITKYISDCNFKLGDRTISTSELLDITNKSVRENELRADSMVQLKKQLDTYEKLVKAHIDYEAEYKTNYNADTFMINKKIVELAERDYGIKYSVSEKAGTYYFSKVTTRADSALWLYPYYKNKISVDSLKQIWIQFEKPSVERKKRKNR